MPSPNRLDSNQLQGTLTGGAWLPSQLQLLSLHHNQLSGALPQDLQLPSTLKQLSLHFNQFTGGKYLLLMYLHYQQDCTGRGGACWRAGCRIPDTSPAGPCLADSVTEIPRA